MAWLLAPSLALAVQTPVALQNTSPELSDLASCLASRLADVVPLERAATLPEGLEFRMQRSASGATDIVVVQGLLKPDVSGLVEAHNHDGDPEAQPEAARRFFHLLRIPVGTRVWQWRPQRQAAICGEMAEWIGYLRSHPVLFDRLEPGSTAP